MALSSCKNSSNAIDQPAQTAYVPPVMQSLKLGKAVKINWASIKAIPMHPLIIPLNLKKIMQPFFTTKPTGEGTGLGLSLTFDMVVKGHIGAITVDSVANEFTVVTVTIPLS